MPDDDTLPLPMVRTRDIPATLPDTIRKTLKAREAPVTETAGRPMNTAEAVAQPEVTDHSASFRTAYDRLVARAHSLILLLLLVELASVVLLATMNGSALSHQFFLGDPQIRMAMIAGAILIVPAILVARIYPAAQISRHLLAVAQVGFSSLLAHTGGRTDVHFEAFGSLAFLALYCDWRVLLTANAVLALGSLVRFDGWPQLVHFALHPVISGWRRGFLWVAAEDLILITACQRIVHAIRASATRESRLHWDACHDGLTRLPNRRMLQDRFSATMKKQGQGALLFIDLDRFKQANDTLGHTLGDRLLAMVGDRLLTVLRPGRAFVARVGGDEFVALIEEATGAEEALAVATELIAALRRPFRVDHEEVLLSASIGISLCPAHGTDLATLQEHADRAMYMAKVNGRGQCAIFSAEGMRQESMMRQMDRDLYLALPRGELRLWFQPLVERTGRLHGFEALLRWQHPTRGLLLPSEFIPSAEKSGLITSIGEWVLWEACRQCMTWRVPPGDGIGVAVNVSAIQFDRNDFPQQVMSVVAESGLRADRLTLELTEGVLMRELARTSQQLARLRAAGVRVALDDFGTGYSSLSYLTSLPVDVIKLDRSFINRPFANAIALVESIVDMAHRIGLRVVAEGIETVAQAREIADLQCDEMQGLCFSGAIPAESVAEFLRDHVSKSGYLLSAAAWMDAEAIADFCEVFSADDCL